MLKRLHLLTLWTAGATALFAQGGVPGALGGAVVDAASFAQGQPVVAGSLVSIFGTNLAASTAAASTVPLSTSLNNVTVTFNGMPAPILFVSSGQLNVQAPWGLGTDGTATMVITNAAGRSAPSDVTVGAAAPGIFAVNFGVGPAIAINQDGSLAAPAGSIPGIPTRPAKIGDPLVILADGLGPVDSSPADGQNSLDMLRRNVNMPVVLIGGVSAQVLFSGLSPQFVGVNQVNVIIPDAAPVGDAVPLQLQAGGITSTDKVTIAVTR
jgi:uncharacterized protein (TIGR03437 family)